MRQMTFSHQPSRLQLAATMLCAAGMLALVVGGCQQPNTSTRMAPGFEQPVVIAVAPILNFSGEFQFDPVRAADLLASELTFVDGVTVLPVNRVMAVLASQGKYQIESPEHAVEIADASGADAILVAGVTEYDAYTPTVGLVMQLYGGKVRSAVSTVSATSVARQARPTLNGLDVGDATQPTSQVQLVLNGSHDRVRKLVEQYAAPRTSDEIHLGWRQYLKVQTLYLRFCWHEAIADLMEQERALRNLSLAARATEAQPR